MTFVQTVQRLELSTASCFRLPMNEGQTPDLIFLRVRRRLPAEENACPTMSTIPDHHLSSGTDQVLNAQRPL